MQSSRFSRFGISTAMLAAALMLSACGELVEIPPAHVGKIMTDKGYQEGTRPPSKFRLDPCMAYCDKIVLLDVSDKAAVEPVKVLIPEDKLYINVDVQTTLALNQKKIDELFVSLKPTAMEGGQSLIEWKSIYDTYVSKIIQKEAGEYLAKYSIAQIASSMERINADLAALLSAKIAASTPFNVRFVGITGVKYPPIIIEAQEATAKRREDIQKEEAQREISKVQLDRELLEARMQRLIDVEKAETEAVAQRALAQSITPQGLDLRRLDNQAAWIAKWNGQLPATSLGEDTMFMLGGGK